MTMESPFVLTGFADEIADDLETQLDVLESLNISHLDLRSVWGTNVLDLDPDQLATIEQELDRRGMTVSAIGSPIGKINVTDPFEPHFDQFKVALNRANRFEAEYIRLFSYWIPDNDDPADHRAEVMRRMNRKVELAADAGVLLLHENEKDIYGDTPGRVRDMITTINSDYLRAIFDPANFLEIGINPYPDALLQIIEFIEFIHIKDCIHDERYEIRPAGEGDGGIPQILVALASRGFTGFASLEPHLSEADKMGGFSGPDGFRDGAKSLMDILDDINVRYC